MKQEFGAMNYRDEYDSPAGGYVTGVGLSIVWQKGPLVVDGVRVNPNGAFVETVIAAAVQRIEEYQDSKFACDENHNALIYLDLALASLESRTKAREARGVEGTHTV